MRALREKHGGLHQAISMNKRPALLKKVGISRNSMHGLSTEFCIFAVRSGAFRHYHITGLLLINKKDDRKNRNHQLLRRTDRTHQRTRLSSTATDGWHRMVGRRTDHPRMRLPASPGRRVGMAPVGMERPCHTRKRMCIRKILHRQGGIHQSGMVARLLQLETKPISTPGR